MKKAAASKFLSSAPGIAIALILVVFSSSTGGQSRKKPLYRSEAIILVEELNCRPAEEQEVVLKNLRARLSDWSVLRSAVKGMNDEKAELRGRIRRSVDAEIIEDDRFRIWLDLDDPVVCRRVMSALTDRIVSEGVETGESEKLAFLRARLDEARDRAEDAERQLDDLVIGHEQFLSEERMAAAVAGTKIKIEKHRMEMEEAVAKRRAIKKKLADISEYIVTSTVVQYGPRVMKLKRTITSKEEKLEEVRSRYGEGNKTGKLEKQIGGLRLKLAAWEGRSQRQETRSLNPLYRDVEDELIEVSDLIERLHDDIEEAEELAEKSKREMKETAALRADKRKLDRAYDEAVVLFEALQEKIEEEFIQGRLGGGELEVKLLVEPTKPSPVLK